MMVQRCFSRQFLIALLLFPSISADAEETASEQRLRKAKEFHARAQERTGVLIPLYVYPANIHKN